MIDFALHLGTIIIMIMIMLYSHIKIKKYISAVPEII